jgi:HlyD family type I secretion membrane fusion protein
MTPGAPVVASSDWRSVVFWGYLTIGVCLGGFFTWAMLARLDGAALAPGVVAVESNRKTVAHLEGGIVREILVRDGDVVKEGQILVKLDPTRVDAIGDLYRNQLTILLAQEARLIAERDFKPAMVLPERVKGALASPAVARAVADQQQQFTVGRETLQRNVELINSQIAQAAQDLEQTSIDARTAEETLKTVTRELAMLRPLFQRNLVPTTRIAPLEREELRLRGVISGSAVQLVKLKERISELEIRRDQTQQEYQQLASTQLLELRKAINDATQQGIVADDALRRAEVRAPNDGTIQQMRVFTAGGVIRAGEPILDLVPLSDSLVIRARISPLDIDRVTAGMTAELRFPAFKSHGVKIIKGVVRSISSDRLLDEQKGDPYFAAEVVVDREELPEAMAEKLTAGMPADVIIPTGERTVMAYLVSPLVERFQTSMRER